MASQEKIETVEQWGVFELALSGSSTGNPYLEVELSAQFNQGNRSIEVSGFYDGDGIYRFRFMPDAPGEWHYQTRCSSNAVSNTSGTFRCIAAGAGNYGPVKVVDAYHFAYADGTNYHPVGTTCYVWHLQGDALAEQTLESLRHAPFNKLRFCVFPKRFLYNNNEPPEYPFPGQAQPGKKPDFFSVSRRAPSSFSWDLDRFNPAYFKNLEKRILSLQKLGIEADLILFHPYDFGAWDFDRLPPEVNTRYLKYIVARLAAFRNVWWSLANEHELLRDRTVEDWDGYFKLIQQTDPYNHPRSIHNIVNFYDHSKPWVTHCSIQHNDLTQTTTWQRKYGKPIVVDECGYEGDISADWGNLSPQELVSRVWLGFADGGYVGHSETYWNESEILWWSKGGVLQGESVPRIAFLRQIIEQVPGRGLVPLSPTRFSYTLTVEKVMELFSSPDEYASIIADGPTNIIAGSHSGRDYYLFYYGTHQPRFRTFNLPEGSFRIDVIDTWEMQVNQLFNAASGQIRVELPMKPFLAIRIIRN